MQRLDVLLQHMEEMEVTCLPSDGRGCDHLEDSYNSDINQRNDQRDTETQRANPEGADCQSLQSTERLSSIINELAVTENESSGSSNENSFCECNNVNASTDNKSSSDTTLIRENVKNADEDCITKTDHKLTEENNENCSIIFNVEDMTSAPEFASASFIQHNTGNCSNNCSTVIQSITCKGKTDTKDCADANSTSYQSRVSAEVPVHLGESQGCEIEVVHQKNENKCSGEKREKDLSRTSILNKSCTGGNTKFQLELKHSSEIKDRVMSFLTKYADVDENSNSEQGSNTTTSKDEFSKEKISCVCSESNITSSITSEEPIELNCNGTDVEFTVNSSESMIPLSTVPVALKKPISCELLSHPPSSMFSQTNASEICQRVIDSPFTLEAPQICKLVFSTPSSEKLQSACAPTTLTTSDENEQILSICNDNDHDASNSTTNMECSTMESISKTKTNAFSFEQKIGNVPNEISSKRLNKLHPLNSSSCSWLQNEHVQCSMLYKDVLNLKQQCELNRSISTCGKQFDFNNSVVKNPCVSSSRNAAFASDKSNLFLNHVAPSVYRNNTCAVPENSTSWGRLSFQPLTTPSINSPISSCVSSNDKDSIKQDALSSDCLPVSSSQASNVNGSFPLPSSWSPKNCSKSRRTKSSEAIFINMPLPSGVTNYLNHTNRININDNLNRILGNSTEKSTNILSNATPPTSNVCYGGLLANGPCKGNTGNPFSKRSSVESIGLFKSSSLKPTVREIGHPLLKSISTSSALFPPKREKIEEIEGAECDTKIAGVSNQSVSRDNSQISFLPSFDSQNNQTMPTNTSFAFGNAKNGKTSKPLEKFIFCSEQTSDAGSDKQSVCVDSGTCESQIKNNSVPFQFTFNAEKTKTYFANRMTWPRPTRKPFKAYKQHDKGCSKNVKESCSVFNTIEKGHTAFKPVYGSDVKVELGVAHNVIVRYQNIVFMEEHVNFSPEELRSQYYVKTRVPAPFKFSTSMKSHEVHNDKKTQNQEIQTEKELAPKKSELAGIWRALECPVCFDVVLPPVYQCEQGHHVCSTCWNKVITCPLCKRLKSGTRNYMAEALIEQVPLPCRYHIEGCKETVQHMNKVSHEETCTYRMYECPVPLCNQAHSYQNMCKHFKKAHKTLLHHEGHSVGKGEKFCDVLYKEALSLFLIHAFDITKWGLFFLRKVTVHSSSALFVQIMPAVADQAAYFYHLEVSDHHDCRKECYKGRVFPMGKSTQDIVDQEEYLCLSDLILKTVNKNTPLKIVVTIWQLKPAFTLSTE